MPVDLHEQLHDAVDHLRGAGFDADRTRREVTRRRQVRGAGTVVAVVLAAVAVLQVPQLAPWPGVALAPVAGPPSPADAAPVGWVDLPAAPITGQGGVAVTDVSAGTGPTGFVVWGGGAGGPVRDGARYDAATNTWITLPEGPLPPLVGAVADDSSGSMTVVGGHDGSGWSRSAAELDLGSGTWRRLPDLPVALADPTGGFNHWPGEFVVGGVTGAPGRERFELWRLATGGRRLPDDPPARGGVPVGGRWERLVVGDGVAAQTSGRVLVSGHGPLAVVAPGAVWVVTGDEDPLDDVDRRAVQVADDRVAAEPEVAAVWSDQELVVTLPSAGVTRRLAVDERGEEVGGNEVPSALTGPVRLHDLDGDVVAVTDGEAAVLDRWTMAWSPLPPHGTGPGALSAVGSDGLAVWPQGPARPGRLLSRRAIGLAQRPADFDPVLTAERLAAVNRVLTITMPAALSGDPDRPGEASPAGPDTVHSLGSVVVTAERLAPDHELASLPPDLQDATHRQTAAGGRLYALPTDNSGANEAALQQGDLQIHLEARAGTPDWLVLEQWLERVSAHRDLPVDARPAGR